MNIFITGATGFIGRSFLSQLLSAMKPEDRIFLLSRKEQGHEDGRIVTLIGNLSDIPKFKNEILSSEYIFHLAANATFGGSCDYDEVNYKPVVKLSDMARESRCLKNLIFTSTIGAVDRGKNDTCQLPLTKNSTPSPTSLYGKSKLKAEEYIKGSGIPYTIIRPTWVYGRDMRTSSHINKFVSMVYQKSPFARLAFPGKVSLIHVDDLSAALVNCINNDRVINKTYFAESEALSIGDIFKTIYTKINHKNLVQIKLPSVKLFVGKLHSNLPLAVSNLFIDYLYAKDGEFKTDFNLGGFKSFINYVDDVISTNIHNSGYWVVTGANSGIGYELSKKLNHLNKKLILIDKDVDKINYFENQVVIKADLSGLEALSELGNTIAKHRIFCLINNAGIGFRGSIKDLTVEEIKKIIDINVSYPPVFTKLLIDNLIKNESVIVNIASSVAFNPLPNMSVYAASKAFISSWSEALSYELKDTNKVITISPSGTYTNFQKNAGVRVTNEGKGLLTPEHVADRIIKSVYGKKGIIVLGGKTKVLLFIARFLPKGINIYFWGKLFEKLR